MAEPATAAAAWLAVSWVDAGREPQHPPNPRFPEGVNVDLSQGATRTCARRLPYPAHRCGYYLVKCERCGLRVMVTTAGRVDDPRSVTLACRFDDG